MAKQRKQKAKTVTLYSSKGTKVTVSEEQAKQLKGAGYTTTAPKSS